MLKRLKDWLASAGEEGATVDADTQHFRAAALLLLEVVRADFDSDASEIRTVDEYLQRESGLSPEEAAALRHAASDELDHRVSLHDALDRVNKAFDPAQKRELMRSMWQVVYADGHLDSMEEHRVRKLSELLYISHADFIQTKLEAQSVAP